MKFKGIELKDNTEAELFIAIEIVNINNEEELKKYGKKLMKNIYNILNYDNCYPYIEFLDDNLPNVRCEEITFDKKGVELLTTTLCGSRQEFRRSRKNCLFYCKWQKNCNSSCNTDRTFVFLYKRSNERQSRSVKDLKT